MKWLMKSMQAGHLYFYQFSSHFFVPFVDANTRQAGEDNVRRMRDENVVSIVSIGKIAVEGPS